MKQIQKESYHWLRISKHVFKQTLQIDVPVHDLSILHLIILSIIDCNISLWGNCSENCSIPSVFLL
jgi:hypothetical protein